MNPQKTVRQSSAAAVHSFVINYNTNMYATRGIQ